jgi:anti-anti-sigma factor
MKHAREPKRLDFVITEEASVLMISFFGELTAATMQDAERHSLPILSTARIKFVVLNFQYVQSMDRQSISLFIRFQMVIRDLGKKIRLCNLGMDHMLILESHDACSAGETVETLMDAMRTFELLKLKS